MRDSFSKIAADRREAFARQVRVSSGFTWSRPKPVVRLAAVAPVAEADKAPPPGRGPARVMAMFRDWPEGEPLVGTGDLALRAGYGAAQRTLSTATAMFVATLRALQGRGEVFVVDVSNGRAGGERMVLLPQTGRVLRTPGAPEHWVDALMRMRERGDRHVGG